MILEGGGQNNWRGTRQNGSTYGGRGGKKAAKAEMRTYLATRTRNASNWRLEGAAESER